LEETIKKPAVIFLLFALVCSQFIRPATADTSAPATATGKGSADAADKVDGVGTGCLEQEGPVFEEDKPRKGAPLVVGAAVVLVVAAVYFLALKKPDTSSTRIEVNSVPDGADIILDGRNIGKVTPYTFPNVTPGTHDVKLTKSGYEDFFINIDVRKGQTAVVNATLIPVQ
jgi:hypothetical protein